MRRVADTAATEANHRPDAGQHEFATRFRGAELGEKAVSEGIGVCGGLLRRCSALAIRRPRASGFERGLTRCNELLLRCLTSFSWTFDTSLPVYTGSILVFDVIVIAVLEKLRSISLKCLKPPRPPRCHLRHVPSPDLR
jgi:hypothetical protein